MSARLKPFRGTAVAALVALSSISVSAQVPYPRIVGADRTPSDWLTYSGNYQAHRYSSLDQVNRQNV